MYDKTTEDVPPFDSSVPYIYWGIDGEKAPKDTVAEKVHPTAPRKKKYAFRALLDLRGGNAEALKESFDNLMMIVENEELKREIEALKRESDAEIIEEMKQEIE